MGGKSSGNRKASGQKGHKGGTGRPPKLPEYKRTIHKCVSPRLWDLINIKAMEACEDDWHAFLEKVLEGRIVLYNKRRNIMSDMDRAIIYEDENKRNPFNLSDVVKRVTALTVEGVAAMTYKELAAVFPKYESGEFRPLQHGKIWEKLAELERNLPQDCREYREKTRILSGIRYDGMHV